VQHIAVLLHQATFIIFFRFEPVQLKTKLKPYFHQISIDCIEKLVECMEGIDIEEMDCDTCFKMQKILRDEIDDEEYNCLVRTPFIIVRKSSFILSHHLS